MSLHITCSCGNLGLWNRKFEKKGRSCRFEESHVPFYMPHSLKMITYPPQSPLSLHITCNCAILEWWNEKLKKKGVSLVSLAYANLVFCLIPYVIVSESNSFIFSFSFCSKAVRQEGNYSFVFPSSLRHLIVVFFSNTFFFVSSENFFRLGQLI